MHDESKPAPVTQVIEFGDVKVTVEATEMKVEPGVFVSLRPETSEEFEEAVAATGGWDGLTLPSHDVGYETHATRSNGVATLMIYEPPRSKEPELSRHPFFNRYRDRTGASA